MSDQDEPEPQGRAELHASLDQGVPPRLLANSAPTLALAVEAFAAEYTDLANRAADTQDGIDGEPEQAYWKGRMDAYNMALSDLSLALIRHDTTDSDLAPWPLMNSETGDTEPGQ